MGSNMDLLLYMKDCSAAAGSYSRCCTHCRLAKFLQIHLDQLEEEVKKKWKKKKETPSFLKFWWNQSIKLKLLLRVDKAVANVDWDHSFSLKRDLDLSVDSMLHLSCATFTLSGCWVLEQQKQQKSCVAKIPRKANVFLLRFWKCWTFLSTLREECLHFPGGGVHTFALKTGRYRRFFTKTLKVSRPKQHLQT